jgi:hypothetical protein
MKNKVIFFQFKNYIMNKLSIENLEAIEGASKAKDIVMGACGALAVGRAAIWYFSLAFPVGTGALVVASLGCVAAAAFMD